jgi:hypothetical protein
VMAAFRERSTGHVTKAYVSDSNQFMVAYWSVYGDFSATLYINCCYLDEMEEGRISKVCSTYLVT